MHAVIAHPACPRRRGAAIGNANADGTNHQGLVLGASLPLGDTVRARGTDLWNDCVFDDDIACGDNCISGIAPHRLHGEVEWRVAP